MNDAQQKHLDKIVVEFVKLVGPKYRKGAEEYGTQLDRDYDAKQLVDMALEEAVDQIVYLVTLRSKL